MQLHKSQGPEVLPFVDVQQLNVIQCLCCLYQSACMCNKLLIMQVFQGVILASRDRFMKNSPLGELPPFGGSVTSPEGYLLGLWVHECQRVFSDKMITLEDKGWVDSAIKELCKTNFTPDLTKQVRAIAMFSDLMLLYVMTLPAPC